MTTYRIQLASNFQVVEFNLNLEDDELFTVQDNRISEAVEVVNQLGKMVENSIKTKEQPKVKAEEMASEAQIKFLKGLGMNETEARKMTKKEAWNFIQKAKE